MWTNPDSGYEWEVVPYTGFKKRLWFAGIKVGRFGFGVMGVKTVVDKDAKDAEDEQIAKVIESIPERREDFDDGA
jgi:hypothetical protein